MNRAPSRVAGVTALLGCASLVLSVLAVANTAPLAPLTTTWTDHFGSPSLSPAWSWLQQDPAYWSLTALPGFLRIITTEQNDNYLVFPAPAGDFEIRTRVVFTPSENFQQAGLGIRLDDANSLTLMRAFCGFGHCVDNGIYYDAVEGGQDLESHRLATQVEGEAYLKIVKQGSAYSGYYSEDGTSWTLVGTHTVGFAPAHVGLRAGNNFQPQAHNIPADFDYFVLEDHSYRAFLPWTLRAHR